MASKMLHSHIKSTQRRRLEKSSDMKEISSTMRSWDKILGAVTELDRIKYDVKREVE